ncbi:MAG TPA: ABC transporter substrate-binding protein [Casimicrobiaceae bacterium]|nr:ABC transporter substrate-binding protein [Casimicrobiaceae bacterium]
MRSRALVPITAFVVALAGAIAPATAQPLAKMHRVGYLAVGSAERGLQNPFRDGLRELGWIEGRNVVIEYRFAEGRPERLPELAAELVRSNVDIIVAQPTPAAMAAKNSTRSIPIVMMNVGDPVGVGLVASLARPGGNVTGVAYDVGLGTFTKQLELLKEAIPGVRRVAVISNPTNPAQALAIKNLVAAKSLELRLALHEARSADDLEPVFARIAGERPDALLVVAEALFDLQRTRVAELALKHRLPTMHGIRENVIAGGLMFYGPSISDNARRGATFVDRILKGAKPGDLPVEQPTKFELVFNQKTATALNLTIPQSLLGRADEIVR